MLRLHILFFLGLSLINNILNSAVASTVSSTSSEQASQNQNDFLSQKNTGSSNWKRGTINKKDNKSNVSDLPQSNNTPASAGITSINQGPYDSICRDKNKVCKMSNAEIEFCKNSSNDPIVLDDKYPLNICRSSSREIILQMFAEPVKSTDPEDHTTKLFKHAIYEARNTCNVKLQDIKVAISKSSDKIQESFKKVQEQLTMLRDDFTIIAWNKYKKALDIPEAANQFQEIRNAYGDALLMAKNCRDQASHSIYLSGLHIPSYTYPPERKCYGASKEPEVNAEAITKSPVN